jgi:hypothetical protein
MKYIEIDLNRAVELYRRGEEKRIFRKCDNGELERLTSFSGTFGLIVTRSRYFEQTEED